MADSGKPTLKVREFALYELERIAAQALAKAPRCVTDRRVDIERLLEEGFAVQLVAFHELQRRWKTYAFIDTKSRTVFVDADLMDNFIEHGHVLVDELANAISHEYDVNYRQPNVA